MKNNPPKISIVIPFYNAEKYISQCIESILAQPISSYEVILVDDGSTDDGFSICKKYALQDGRITVLHQKNQGVSAARNRGITAACGEYVGFVDSDDYIRPDMFQVLLGHAERYDADVTLCDSIAISDDGVQEHETIGSLGTTGLLQKAAIQPSVLLEMAGAVWRCIYKTSFLRNYRIQFPVGLKIAEDRIFNLYAMGYAERMVYVKEPLYFRTLNDNSTVHRYHADYPAIVERGRVATVEALEKAWDNHPKFQICYKRQYVEGCLNAIENEKRADAHHSFLRRYLEIRSICRNEKLIDAITSTSYQQENLTCKWILQKRYGIVSLRNQKILRRADSVMSQIQKGGVRKYIGRLVKKVVKRR
ncbi:MAG: glycosyltransferase [Ruminococcaceae bacterium]|nr:glycosyltransferase [Oscillospiraceae bacterium]